MMQTTEVADIHRLVTHWRSWLSGVVVTGLIVAGMLYFMDSLLLTDRPAAISWGWLVAAYCFLWINQFVSSLRLIIAARVPVTSANYLYALKVNVLQQVAVRSLPMRLSEVLWVYLVKKGFQFNIGKTLSLLVHIRTWDLCILLGLIIVVIPLAFVGGYSGESQAILIIMAIGGLSLLVLLPTRIFFRFTRAVSGWMRIQRWLRLCRIHGMKMLHSLRMAAQYRPGPQIILALTGWVSAFACLMSILEAIGLNLPLHEILIALTMLLISSALPLPALGIVGGGELGFAASLSAMGLGLGEASRAALLLGLMHSLLSFLVGGLWGLFALFSGYRLRKQRGQ